MAETDPLKVCHFYLTKKKRKCRMLVAKGNLYCGQHMVHSGKNSKGHTRIPCPLDPNHSCYLHQLEQHLKVCNSREPVHLPYYKKNINCLAISLPVSTSSGLSLGNRSLSQLTDEDLLSLIDTVLKCHTEHAEELHLEELVHASLLESVKQSESSSTTNAEKHLRQNASIIGHIYKCMSNNLTCDDKQTFIEFGAGRGQLSHLMNQSSTSPMHFVLIDKGAQRYKFDPKMADVENTKTTRLHLNIADVDLRSVDEIDFDSGIIAAGKHVCGAATDLSLMCLKQAGLLTSHKTAVVIALCCLHKCSWELYTGAKFLQSCGFSGEDFTSLMGLTSWAVCAARPPASNTSTAGTPVAISSEEKLIDAEDEHAQGAVDDNTTLNRYKRLNLTIAKREEVGRATRHLIHLGRVKYLRELGLDAKLVYYVKPETTLENIALIASL